MSEQVQAKLRQSVNEVNIEGYLNSMNLKADTDRNGKEYIGGSFEIRLDDSNIIPVEVFSHKLTKDGNENKVYKGLETAMSKYIDATKVEHYTEATKVRVNKGSIKTNEFVGGQNNEVLSATKYATNFINSVDNPDEFGTKATFKIEVAIRDIKAEMKNDEETGRGFIYGYYVDFMGNLQNITLVAEGKHWEQIEAKVEKGETITFWGDIRNSVHTFEQVIEADFGDDEIKVITRTTKERVITGAKYTDEEKAFTQEQIAEGLRAKVAYHEELKQKALFGGTQPSTQSTPATTNNKQEADGGIW